MAKHFEIVVFTAAMKLYADPVLDVLDPNQQLIRFRLYHDSCVQHDGTGKSTFHVKDLSFLGRDLSQVVIVDNSPKSFVLHPHNAIGCSSFKDSPKDKELQLIATFLMAIKGERDVRGICHRWRDWHSSHLAQRND